jgi:predicted nucleotidyltransferase
MQRDEIIEVLSAHKSEFEEMGVRSLSLFGPVLTQELPPDWEVDILAEFSRPVGFEYYRLKVWLAELLGRPVNLAPSYDLTARERVMLGQGVLRAA